MVQTTADHPESEHKATVAAFGPADATLFDTLNARLTDLDLYTTPDGTLLATTADTAVAVRLAVTDRGLAATETSTQEYTEDELTSVDQINPAPEADVDADLSTRLRGD